MKIFPLSYNSWTETSEMLLDRDLHGTFKEAAKIAATILEKHTGEATYETCEFDEVCKWGYESTGNLAGILELMRGIIRTYETRFARGAESLGWSNILLSLMIQFSTLGIAESAPTPFPVLIKTNKEDVVEAYREHYNQRAGKYGSCYKPSWRR